MTCWHIHLLGGLRAEQHATTVTRFRTRKTASLLAYLAYYKNRTHPRDELAELLWSEDEPEAARVSLRTSLASLRRQLEPPGTVANTVLLSDRSNIGLNPSAVETDVSLFQEAICTANAAESAAVREHWLGLAVQRYGGPLLPGFYDDWLLIERQRLEETYLAALHELADRAEYGGDLNRALDLALRAASADPTNEAAHERALRIYQALGRPAAARRMYEGLARRLWDEIGVQPSLEAPSSQEPDALARGEHCSPSARRYRVSRNRPIVKPRPFGTSGAIAAPDLPRPLTSFFGREEEIERIARMLCGSPTTGGSSPVRLLTLTGPGGTGKTRIAIEAARRLMSSYEGSAWFISLAEVDHEDGLLPTISRVVLGPGSGPDDPLDELVTRLHGGPALLVLDNVEHLTPAAAPKIAALLHRIPSVSCLATSRVRLCVEGEYTLPVSPLPLPQCEQDTPLLALDSPSVRLFVDRAQAARPDFQLTPANTRAVTELCRRLEGLPLAIELAASWAQVLTPAQMLQRTESGLTSLSHRRKGVAQRHQSLAATAEWSFRLLDIELKRLFALLSVFRGSWSPEAAAALLAQDVDTAPDPDAALHLLARLAEASLIVPHACGAGQSRTIRFRMLETLREFAGEHLQEPERSAACVAHAHYSLAAAERLEREMEGPERSASLAVMELDIDNIRAALAWSLVGAPAVALRLAVATYRYWDSRGHFREGRHWLLQSLNGAGELAEKADRARAFHLAGRLSWRLGEHVAARRQAEESVSLLEEAGHQTSAAESLNLLAILALDEGDVAAARRQFGRALRQYHQAGDHAGAAKVLHNLGAIESTHGDLAKGRRLLVQSLARAEAADNDDVRMTAMMSLAEVAASQDDFCEARRLYTEVLCWASGGQDAHRQANAVKGLARVEFLEGNFGEARSLCLQSLAIFEESGERAGVAACLSLLGQVATMRGNYSVARERLRASLRIYLDLNQIALQGLVVWCFACLAAREGRYRDAALLMGVEDSVRQSLGTTVQSAYRREYERLVETTVSALGRPCFTEAFEEGGGTPLRHTINRLLVDGPVPSALTVMRQNRVHSRAAAL